MLLPPVNLMPRSELESLKLSEMYRRRREITDAALRGGHPYHLAKKWALQEVPESEMQAVREERERLRINERYVSAQAEQRPWWKVF